jgi:hypothetical protein
VSTSATVDKVSSAPLAAVNLADRSFPKVSNEPTAKEMLWSELPSTRTHTGNKNRLLASSLCLALLSFLNWESLEFSGFRKPNQSFSVVVSGNATKHAEDSQMIHPSQGSIVVSGEATKNAEDSQLIHPSQGSEVVYGEATKNAEDLQIIQPIQGSVVVSGEATKNAEDSQMIQPIQGSVVVSGEATKNAEDSQMMHPNVTLFTPPNNHHIAYSNARRDRSGSAISNMLAAHAYAFHHNMTYGGACLRLPKDATHSTIQKFEKHIKQHQALIDAIGLNGLIGFLHCSTNQTAALISSKRYMEADAFWYTPEWLEYMHQHIDYPLLSKKKKDNSNSTRLEVAVHVRRGDIQPCNRWSHRYLPNSYYQRILDEYLVDEDKAQVTIFSEKNSFEPLAEFSAKNYTLKLDTDLTSVWMDIMIADVVLLSCSAFSYVPALLNPKARVIYTEFHMQPLEGWEVIRRNSTFMKATKEEVEQMKHNCKK